jgi:ssDNA-binding Zn-finger/Zn-ribbon topoisomerase 1
MNDMNIKIYRENIEWDSMNNGVCRKCGGNLIPRQNKNTGEIFNWCEYYKYHE